MENEPLLDTITNLQISKHFYKTMYNTADNLDEMLLNSPMQYQEAFDRDMQLNGWSFLNFSLSSSREIITTFNYFINGRFPADDKRYKSRFYSN